MLNVMNKKLFSLSRKHKSTALVKIFKKVFFCVSAPYIVMSKNVRFYHLFSKNIW